MRHITALVIKFIIVATVLFSILTIFEVVNLTEIFLSSILVTGLAYVIGDLFILPRYGNAVASIADFFLATGSVWLLNFIFIGQAAGSLPVFAASAFAGFLIALCEALFHIYMKESVLEDTDTDNQRNTTPTHLQTEFSRENNIHDIKKRRNRKK